MLPSKRRALIILPIWIGCLLWMWGWWIDAQRIGYAPLFIPLTLALLYEFAFLPSVFLYFLFRVKYPKKRIAPSGKKVAVITLCVPAKESIEIVERQLKAMSQITYLHDSWILDEGNSSIVKQLAKKYGVKHFSRKGVSKYNQELPPFKAKTKAGNVNAWLEHTKRRKYEYFVQLDIDHIPAKNYLHKTLGYFRDEQVGWVQAPSVYNNRSIWTARGSAEQELALQGPLQMGFYGHSETPFIIGSHCTYRTSAIREIGGFQPTRAEDHLDTVMLAAKQYKGVFLPEVIAEGDGPESLEVYLAQQFAWAYSMLQVLTKHTPKLLSKLSWGQRFQFLFSQTWYPLWSVSYFITFLVPVVSLFLNREVAHMQGSDFVDHFIPLFVCSFLVWWCAKPIMQPAGVSLSWRGMLLHVVRWPVVLKAVLSALLKVKKPYMITPKGRHVQSDIPSINVYRPFLLLGLISASAVLYSSHTYQQQAPESQIIFALTNAIFMLSICLVDLDIRLRRAASTLFSLNKFWLKPTAAVAILAVVVATSLITSPLVTYQMVAALGEPPVNEAIPLTSRSTAELTREISQIKNTNKTMPNIGIYSPGGPLNSTQPYIRHSFVDWRKPHYLAEQILITEQMGDTPLITIEPRGESDGKALLEGITNGAYDDRLQQITDIVAASNQPVYIRFAHEMELTDLYPWAAQDPTVYINAFRHVVDFSRSHHATQARWVWSPAGNIGADDYYPGDDAVDVIGTTVLYDKYWYGDYRPNFTEIAESRVRLENYGKPVWIVEFGAGNADIAFQDLMVNDALSSFQQQGFSALVYLNIADANISGPDYRLHSLQTFSSTFGAKAKTVAQTKPHYDTHKSPAANYQKKTCRSDNQSKSQTAKSEPAILPLLAANCD